MEEQKTYFCMVIWPNSVVSDITILEIPVTGRRISIDNKNYRIVEAHTSAHEKWAYAMTLGN